MKQRPASQGLLTTHDVSRLIGIDPSTISKWIDKGFLLAFRTPGGHRRVRPADLRTFLIANEMPVPPDLGSGPVRLVVVDDEKPVLDALRRAFKPYEGIELSMTTSGIEALLLVTEQRPHGLLIDLNLPDLDGLEVCRRLGGRAHLSNTKMLTMTSNWTDEVVKQSLEAGALACLSKPVAPAEVLEHFKLAYAWVPEG